MTSLRRFSYAVFGVACTHLVFGAIVRISGSGMGCGPHWPKCYGSWFPPMDRPDLIIEVTHRYLASILLLSLIALAVAAYRRRAEPGVGGRGGVLRMASLATALGFTAAILGAVTVKLGNSAPATVAHWTVAMSLVAAVTATLIRAGGLGGDAARRGGASRKTRRGTFAGAGLALTAVVMGGLTAKVQGGPIACLAFPLCGANPDVPRNAVHVQSGHRVIAVLLVLHLLGLFFALRKRKESPVVFRAATIALTLGVFQLLLAGAMIGMHLPPVLRSMHEATGVSIWIATFALAYLARIASDGPLVGEITMAAPVVPSAPLDVDPIAAAVRATPTSRPVFASVATLPAPSSAVKSLALETSVLTIAPMSIDAIVVADVHDAIDLPGSNMAPERALADEPIELAAALEVASRGALTASLASFRVASEAVGVAAGLEIAERVVVLAPVVEPVPGAAVALDEVVRAGGPPENQDTSSADEEPHHPAARVTIFDAAPVADADDVDELYNLRGLDSVDDDDELEVDGDAEHVPTLDEEFSLQASAHEVDDFVDEPLVAESLAPMISVAEVVDSAPVEIAPVVHPSTPVGRIPVGTLLEISALRRPAMSHSIAVIVARGADF